jgi:hypothetical protein
MSPHKHCPTPDSITKMRLGKRPWRKAAPLTFFLIAHQWRMAQLAASKGMKNGTNQGSSFGTIWKRFAAPCQTICTRQLGKPFKLG